MIHLGDITKISGYTAPPVEVIIGGSPCQGLSQAGCRKGLSDDRSVLFLDQTRVTWEMREYDKKVNGRTGVDVRPRYMVWENVPGAFSTADGEDFRRVLEETARIADENAVIPRPEGGKWTTAGCIMGDGWSIAWRVLDAQFWGVPQRRRRIALVADFGGYTAPEILFERESVCGDSQASGTSWEGTAGDAENGVGNAIDAVKCLTPWACQSKRVFDTTGVISTYQAMVDGGANNVAICIGSQQGGAACEIELCPTLTQAAETSGNNQPCVVYNEETITSKANASNPRVGDPCHTLGATGAARTICIQGNCIDRADTAGCNGKGWRDDDVSFTLNTIDRPAVYDCRGNGDGETVPTLTGDHQNRVTDYTAITYQQTTGTLMANSHPGSYTGQDAYNDMLVARALRASGSDPQREDYATYPITKSLVRRLTPLECERLQGYPDGWTDLSEWTDSKGRVHQTSDSARYKALGNSIALPPWRFVLGRLNAYLTEHTMASLFDGIGGFPLIWQELNGCGKCLWASEIEEFSIAVTKRRFEDV